MFPVKEGSLIVRVILFSFGYIEYVTQLGKALSKFEEVLLMVPKYKSKYKRKWTEQIIRTVKEDLNIRYYYQPRIRYPINLVGVFRIIKHINSFNPDIIHLQGDHPWFNLTLPLLKRKYPLVVTVHDITWHVGDKQSTKIPSFVHKLVVRYADQVIVHGKKLKELLMEKDNKSPGSIQVIPHGEFSFYEKFSKRTVKEENHLVLFFGRIWEYKGLRYLIEAEPLISEKVPTVKIVIAGRGEDFRKYQEMMVHKEKFIVHNKHIPNEMVAELFRKASIVVLPYIEASQSGIVPLAYAFKKPVVATNVGSIPEVVEDGRTGYIVPPKNPEKLAEAIIDLLRDKEKRREMGENGYKKTEGELSWDSIAAKTIQVYEKALLDRCKSSH